MNPSPTFARAWASSPTNNNNRGKLRFNFEGRQPLKCFQIFKITFLMFQFFVCTFNHKKKLFLKLHEYLIHTPPSGKILKVCQHVFDHPRLSPMHVVGRNYSHFQKGLGLHCHQIILCRWLHAMRPAG